MIQPVKKAVAKEKLKEGYVLKIEQTTGPVWRVKECVGDNCPQLFKSESVLLVGDDPYRRLGNDVLMENEFWFDLEYVEEYESDVTNQVYAVYRIKKWNIIYPIKNGVSKKYLCRFQIRIVPRKEYNNNF